MNLIWTLIGLIVLAWAFSRNTREKDGHVGAQYVQPEDVRDLLLRGSMTSHDITEQMPLAKHRIVYEFATEGRSVVLTYTHKMHEASERETLTARSTTNAGFTAHYIDGTLECVRYGAEITRHREDVDLLESGQLLALLISVRKALESSGKVRHCAAGT